MKKIILSLVALICATVSFAQSSLLATLSHEGTVKTYYGASALKSAHAAATHGDVITLSPGSFLATDITKAITLRGAGMDFDSLSLREPTIITGDFKLNIANDVSERLTIEGIYHNHYLYYTNVVNPMFLKCRFKHITYTGSNPILKNANFIHCKISDDITLTSSCTASFLSSVINYPYNGGSNSVFEFINCIIRTSEFGYITNSSIKNSFLYEHNSYSTIPSSSTMFNNVGLCKTTSENSRIFRNSPNTTNKTVTSLSEVFKTWTGAWDDDVKFELTDDAKKKYLGTDGTQIAIFGGNLPFESTPSNPQITKCNVASKSTADGKLSVDITIKAAE